MTNGCKKWVWKIGYEQKENSDEGIQYVKRDKDSEMQRIGMVTIKLLEFYKQSKEICIFTTYKYRDGTESKSEVGIICLKELNAIKAQALELGWQL